MANEQNLKPFTSNQDRDAAKRNGKKGGAATAAKWKRLKSEKEAIKELFAMKVEDFPEIEKIAKKHGVDSDESIQKLFNILALKKELKKAPEFDTLIKYQKIAGEYEGFSRPGPDPGEASTTSLIDNILFSEKQEKFIEMPLNRINLLYGSVRSGKTYVSLVKFIKEVKASESGAEFLIAGKTLTSVNRNCFGIIAELCGNMWNVSLSAKKAKLFGHTIWIEGANDKASESKIRGMTLQGAYIDELTQIPEEFYLMCLSRLSKPKAWLIATTNPDAPNHYVKSEIIDNDNLDKQVVKYMLDDNIYLDAEYVENLKKEYTGVFYDRFILGEFVRAEGIIFPEFASNPTPWIVDHSAVPKQFKRLEVGFDVGGQGSHHALTATAEGYDGVFYVLKAIDIDPSGMNMLEIETMVKEFCEEVEREYNHNIEFINADWVDVVINSINDNTRYRCGKTYKPPLTDRPLTFGKLFATKQLLFVKDKCNDLIEELQNVVYDEKADKDIMLDDGVQLIDCIDSLTYSLASVWSWLSLTSEKNKE